MTADEFSKSADQLSDAATRLGADLHALALNAHEVASHAMSATPGDGVSFVVVGLTVFVLACFVGYHVVWRVTPALHSPLMAVTNAISSVIIVGALIAAGPAGFNFAKVMGFVAVVLASVNIFGGFIVTQRMLSMFKKKK
jgi:NAD(P) transhydrogenase subunit alpha